jgi:hypothetical protein
LIEDLEGDFGGIIPTGFVNFAECTITDSFSSDKVAFREFRRGISIKSLGRVG